MSEQPTHHGDHPGSPPDGRPDGRPDSRAGGSSAEQPAVTASPSRSATSYRTLRLGVGPEWSSGQLALGAVSTGGAALFLVALYFAAGGFDLIWWLLVLVPVLTLSMAGSGMSLGFWALMLYGWFLLTDSGSFTWWSLPAAAGLLVSHAATALSASMPPAGQLASAAVHRWGRLIGIAFSAAAVVCCAAAALHGRSLALGPAAYVIGLVGLAAGVWLVRTNPPSQSH